MPQLLLQRRQLFAQDTLALVDWGGRDDAAVERLSNAMVKTLRRELALLAQVKERGRLDGLWAAIHMIRTQGETINMRVFSPETQVAIRKALDMHRPLLESDAQGFMLAEEITRALDEILEIFETTRS